MKTSLTIVSKILNGVQENTIILMELELKGLFKKKSKKVRAVNVKTGEVLTFNSVKEAEKKGYHNTSQACRGTYGTRGHLYKGYVWSHEKVEENEGE